MTTKNNELLNQIRDNASAEYQENIPSAASVSGREVWSAISNYPTSKNEFINTLVNKVVKTEFFNKAYSNPLSFLHRGKLALGESIEQLFVNMAERKNFNENFGSNSAESLIGKETASVIPNYISKNFAYKWKITVSESQLQYAFTTSTGLAALVSKLVESAYNNMYYSQYEDMKGILLRDGAKKSNGTLSNGLIGDVNALSVENRTMVIPVKNDIKDLAKKIRAYTDRLTFVSDKYNLNKVKTHTLGNELVLFTTPEVKSDLDIDILAFAFNIDKAEVHKRIVLLDELGSIKGSSLCVDPETEKEVKCILADRDVFQQYTTVEESRTFENADTLSYNLFIHNQGISAKCDFANALIFRAE